MPDSVSVEATSWDASKWSVIQPTDDPQWLEKWDTPVAWGLACLQWN